MIDNTQEQEYVPESSQKVCLQTLVRRLGQDVIDHGITKREQALSVIDRHNHILASENTPDRDKHNPKIEFIFRYAENEGEPLALLTLTDKIYLPLSYEDKKTISDQLIDELFTINHNKGGSEEYPPRIASLNKKISQNGKLEDWKLRTVCQKDYLDGWDTYKIVIEKEDKQSYTKLFIDLFGSLTIDSRILISPNFEQDLSEMQEVVKQTAEWLSLPYSAKLDYEFAMKEPDKQESADSPAMLSESFPKYFHSVLEYWKGIPNVRNLRALIGRSTDENIPILILEDPNLIGSLARNVNLDKIMRGLSDTTDGMVVASHPDVYLAFNQSLQNQSVNPNLSAIFPTDNYFDREWLHMFVQIDDNGKASLVEDIASNNGKDDVRELLPKIEQQYGIGYDGAIDIAMAEREARRPMFMPKINTETAIIEAKYGSLAAKKFRGYAISALIDGNTFALEKYEAFDKLL